MHESHAARCSVLLPKRLVDRVPLAERRLPPDPAMSGQDACGLAERIGALPGVMTTRTGLVDGSTATDFLVEPPYLLWGACNGPLLMCQIDVDGILLPQIGPVDRAEVVKKGWASRAGDSLTIFLPRDSIEMETAWRIVLLVYRYLTTRPSAARDKRKRPAILPNFSSTAKYWM